MSQPYPTVPTGSLSLPPSPLDLGKTISSAFKIMRARLGQMIVLTLLPVATAMVLVSAAVIPMVVGMTQIMQTRRFSPMILVAVLLMFLATMISTLMQVKAQGMMVLAAHDTIEQRSSSIGELWSRTKGVVGRVLALALLVMCVVMLLYGVMVGVLVTMILRMIQNQQNMENAILALVGIYLIFLVVMAAMSIVGVYLQTRLLYFVPILAVEGTPAMDSLKRSWSLTKGNVLRTLGYYLIGSFIVSAASGAASTVGQLFMVPTMGTSSRTSSPDAAAAQLLAMVPGLIILLLLQLAVMLLAVPFLMSYITVMFVDQVRRSQLPNGGRGAYGAVYATPGQPQQQGWTQPQQGWWQSPPQQPPPQQGWQQPPPNQGWQ